MVIHYEEALYQVYGPLPFTFYYPQVTFEPATGTLPRARH